MPWPLTPTAGTWDDDFFFTAVEVIHDLIARPRVRHYHEYADDWHFSDFHRQIAQELYRHRTNALFAETDVQLALAEKGVDAGLLVLTPRDGREDLLARVVERPQDPTRDSVVRAIVQFRDRSADRIQKRAACILLAHSLESLRGDVKKQLLSKDEGLLFQLANQFAIRHQNVDQHSDYSEEYLDWIFWIFLSTVELMQNLPNERVVNSNPNENASND